MNSICPHHHHHFVVVCLFCLEIGDNFPGQIIIIIKLIDWLIFNWNEMNGEKEKVFYYSNNNNWNNNKTKRATWESHNRKEYLFFIIIRISLVKNAYLLLVWLMVKQNQIQKKKPGACLFWVFESIFLTFVKEKKKLSRLDIVLFCMLFVYK